MSGRSSGHDFLTAGLVLTVAVALAGCNGDTPARDGTDNATTASPPIALPPPIKRSVTYRCKDNSVVSVDFLADNLTANVRTDAGILQLKASNPGEPFKGHDQTLVAHDGGITLTQAGKEPRQCKT